MNGAKQPGLIFPILLRFLILVVLILGIFFRFANLEKKVYWGDETFTSLRVAGYQWSEYSQVFDGREYRIEDIQKYQRLTPKRQLIDTINSLAVEDPHHPPLYYAIARFWQSKFGDSIAVRRSLPALISLLVFPCIYWLCLELFQSPLTGWIAIAIASVSPFYLLYAQEVREFSLWIVTILLSSVALLRAMRQYTNLSWGIYAVTLALSFYTFLFSILVAIGHGIYVLVVDNFRFGQRFSAYLLASIAAILMFSPWLFVVFNNLEQIQVANADKISRVSLSYLIKTWVVGITRVFFDVQFGYQDPFDVKFGYDEPITYLIPIALILVIYAIYFLVCQTPKTVWVFIVTLIGVTALALILPDVMLGGTRSIIARYFIPCYLGIQLAVAYLLANKIYASSVTVQQKKIWQFILVAVISGSVLSCVLISQAETWWTKYTDYYNAQIGRIINQTERPLLITDSPFRVLPLSYAIAPKARLQVLTNPNKIPAISNRFSNIFFYSSDGKRSRKLITRLEQKQNVKLKLVYQAMLTFKNREISLWKFTKK